jgi:UTP--glucose-1-phosphate uridylyltransferase
VTEHLDDGLMQIAGLVEKPKPADAPSGYAAIGGYVLTAGIIDALRTLTEQWYTRRTGEIYLTDAINAYARDHAVYGQVIHGQWYDTGNPLDYLIAQFAAALADPASAPYLRRLATNTPS